MYYKVWVEDEYLNRIELFEKIEKLELEDWLFKHAALYDGNWWIEPISYSVFEELGLHWNAMGYIVKYEKV